MVFLMNGQIMDLVIRYVKGMLVRGSEEGFVIILSLLVVEELVNSKVSIYVKHYPVKVKFHFNLRIKMRNVSISISNDH